MRRLKAQSESGIIERSERRTKRGRRRRRRREDQESRTREMMAGSIKQRNAFIENLFLPPLLPSLPSPKIRKEVQKL